MGSLAQRLDELSVAPLERGKDRASARPAALGEEAGPSAQKLRPRQGGHWTLVQRVLPRQHRAAERRLPQGVRGTLAVRDVQNPREHASTIEPCLGTEIEPPALAAGGNRSASSRRSN